EKEKKGKGVSSTKSASPLKATQRFLIGRICSSRSSIVLSTQLFFCERVSLGFKDTTYHKKFLEMGRGPGRPRKSSPRYQPSATAALAARASEQQSKQQKQETSNPDQWVEPPLPPLRP